MESSAILLGHLHGVAERAAAAQDDADLADGIAGRHEARDEAWPHSWCDGLALLWVHHPAALLEAAEDALDRGFEVGEGDARALTARRQRRLVDHVRQIGAAESGGQARSAFQIEVRCKRDAAAVNLQDLQPPDQVGVSEHDLAIEPTRPQQRRIQNLRTIRGRHDDDGVLGAGVEAVDLCQELIQRLLALVVRHQNGRRRGSGRWRRSRR